MANREEHVRKLLQGIAEKEEYKLAKIDITPITSEGNFSTVLFVATISEQLKPDLHLFVKTTNLKEEFRAQNQVRNTLYKTEALFYTELLLNFERIYNKNSVPVRDRMLIPKYYGHSATSGSETLVLENLQKIGYLNFDRLKPLNWEYASASVTELAKFHALGLALRDESPMEFEKLMTSLGTRSETGDEGTEFFGKAIVKGCEILNEEYKSRLQRYCNVEKYGELAAMINNGTMLVFVDFRPSNLMHRTRNGKLEIITLDYQTLRLGNPVVDLMYFIFTSSDEEFRGVYYQRLLDHYFTRLTLALRQLNVDVEKVYSRRTFELDLMEIFGLYTGLALLPLFLVDAEDAPEDVENMDNFQVKPNKLAVERMNGIVRDFVKWGVV